MFVIKTYKVKKFFENLKKFLTNFRKEWTKFPVIFCGKFSEIFELTILVVSDIWR